MNTTQQDAVKSVLNATQIANQFGIHHTERIKIFFSKSSIKPKFDKYAVIPLKFSVDDKPLDTKFRFLISSHINDIIQHTTYEFWVATIDSSKLSTFRRYDGQEFKYCNPIIQYVTDHGIINELMEFVMDKESISAYDE